MRRADQPPRLLQRRLAHGGQIQQRRKFFGEMLDEVNFAVEIKNL